MKAILQAAQETIASEGLYIKSGAIIYKDPDEKVTHLDIKMTYKGRNDLGSLISIFRLEARYLNEIIEHLIAVKDHINVQQSS